MLTFKSYTISLELEYIFLKTQKTEINSGMAKW